MIKYDHIKLKSVGRQTLNQQVYESIKMSILNHDLEPGTKLNEVKIAEQLNVSATPVREAFRMLASEGLVIIQPWKGVVVQEFSDEEVLEVYQCREALELLAFELTFNNNKVSEDDIKELEKIARISENTDNVTEIVYTNSILHDFWITGSGNSRLIYLIRLLDDVLLHDRNISANDNKRKSEIANEHFAIIDALKEGDYEKAKIALRTHIRSGYKYSKEIRENAKGSQKTTVE